MKERPIIFSAPMVRAILDGRKTMTRRVVKTNSVKYDVINGVPCPRPFLCPYGNPGDRLWVRETFTTTYVRDEEGEFFVYKADGDDWAAPWTPSIFMPRSASRITLEITGEWVERLQDITKEDAIKEGIIPLQSRAQYGEEIMFKILWESINGPGSWDQNPLVWVITFKRIEP